MKMNVGTLFKMNRKTFTSQNGLLPTTLLKLAQKEQPAWLEEKMDFYRKFVNMYTNSQMFTALPIGWIELSWVLLIIHSALMTVITDWKNYTHFISHHQKESAQECFRNDGTANRKISLPPYCDMSRQQAWCFNCIF